jgi:hypothetical protein
MRLDSTTAATVNLEQLVRALRRWYESTGDARPNQLLGDFGRARAQNGGVADETIERGLVLLAVQRFGPMDVPDPAGPPPDGLDGRQIRQPYPRRGSSKGGHA